MNRPTGCFVTNILLRQTKDVPLMHEKRTEHVNLLTKEMWLLTKQVGL